MERPRIPRLWIRSRGEQLTIQQVFKTCDEPAVQHAIDVRDKRPGHEKIKLGLVVAGGGNAAVASAGILEGMTERGFNGVFGYEVGVSAGGANVAFTAAGQTDAGLAIYQNLAEQGLFRRRPDKYGNFIDLHLLKKEFGRLDQDAVRRSHADIFIGVSHARTGEGKLIDLKAQKNMLDALVATCNAPVLSKMAVVLDGDPCMDGMPDNGLPIQSAIDQECTDIIVLLNRPRAEHTGRTPRAESFVVNLMSRRYSPGLRKAVRGVDAKVEAQLRAAESQSKVNVTIISPESNPLSRTSKNTKQMEEVFGAGRERAFTIFPALPKPAAPEREVILLSA